MKNINTLLVIIVIALIGIYFFKSQDVQKVSELPSESTQAEVVQKEVVLEETSAFANIYTNALFGFEMSYPDTCDALDDSNNLYGWPNGVVLFYCGGQAYAIAVEEWNTVVAYQAKYSSNEVVVEMIDGHYITIFDMAKTQISADVIATFSIL